MPERTASSTMYWMAGLSTMGSISLGMALVAGRTRVPSPAAGITAFVTFIVQSPLWLGPHDRAGPQHVLQFVPENRRKNAHKYFYYSIFDLVLQVNTPQRRHSQGNSGG